MTQVSGFRMSGQAMSEALVSLPVLVFVILAAVSLYNLMSADIDVSKSARLAAEHGILYQEGAGGLNRQAINQRIERNLSQTLLDTDRRDFTGGSRGTSTPLVSAIRPGGNQLAIKPVDLGSSTGAYASAATDVAKMVGLDNTNLSGVTISIPVKSNSELLSVIRPTSMLGYTATNRSAPVDPIAERQRYYLKGSAALLTNGLTPTNEETFKSNVASLAADGGTLALFQPLATPLAVPLQEMRNGTGDEGRSTVADGQSNVLPSQLGQFRP
jgi:hypothetical protein